MRAEAKARNGFYKAQRLLAAGDLIVPGSWGKTILGVGPQHNRFYAEYLLEKIRELEFSDKPSRMESAFVFEDRTYAVNWSRNLQEHVYEVELVDPSSKVHRGDIRWIDAMPTRRTFSGVEEVARRYWQGVPAGDASGIELVIAGDLRVLNRITPIADDEAKEEASN